MNLQGQIFFKDGDAYRVETYGPVTCLCVAVEESSIQWRFETAEVIEYLREALCQSITPTM